jgi:hypothetical protein
VQPWIARSIARPTMPGLNTGSVSGVVTTSNLISVLRPRAQGASQATTGASRVDLTTTVLRGWVDARPCPRGSPNRWQVAQHLGDRRARPDFVAPSDRELVVVKRPSGPRGFFAHLG